MSTTRTAAMRKTLNKRKRLHARQRHTRGWDDSETWSLDHSLALVILPRLKRFREVTKGYPGSLKSIDEWKSILDRMIAAFEFHADVPWDGSDKDLRKAQAGVRLFAKWYAALWW